MNTATIHVTPDPDTDADDVVVGIEDAAYAEIALAAIHPDPDNQTRPVDAAFVASIKTHGVLQPVLVCPRDTGDGYDLVAGERRWTAASRSSSRSRNRFN